MLGEEEGEGALVRTTEQNSGRKKQLYILYVHWETGAGVTGKRWFRKVRGSCECGLGRAAEKLLFLEQEWQKRGLATDLFKIPC